MAFPVLAKCITCWQTQVHNADWNQQQKPLESDLAKAKSEAYVASNWQWTLSSRIKYFLFFSKTFLSEIPYRVKEAFVASLGWALRYWALSEVSRNNSCSVSAPPQMQSSSNYKLMLIIIIIKSLLDNLSHVFQFPSLWGSDNPDLVWTIPSTTLQQLLHVFVISGKGPWTCGRLWRWMARGFVTRACSWANCLINPHPFQIQEMMSSGLS